MEEARLKCNVEMACAAVEAESGTHWTFGSHIVREHITLPKQIATQIAEESLKETGRIRLWINLANGTRIPICTIIPGPWIPLPLPVIPKSPYHDMSMNDTNLKFLRCFFNIAYRMLMFLIIRRKYHRCCS